MAIPLRWAKWPVSMAAARLEYCALSNGRGLRQSYEQLRADQFHREDDAERLRAKSGFEAIAQECETARDED
jgi:hypothetical protein